MAEPISIQQLKDASEDAITLADFIYKPANVMIPRRLAADINSLQYYLDYMSSYAQHSYETYDEMAANAVNLPNGVSAFVTNDLDPAKNGIYTYNGTSFVKGDYQPENAAKEFVEAKLGGLEVFDGKVRAQDVSTVDGSTQDIKNTEFRNELDALPFEDGVLADTFVTMTKKAPDAVTRNLRDVNSETLSTLDFGLVGDGVTPEQKLLTIATSNKNDLLIPETANSYYIKKDLLENLITEPTRLIGVNGRPTLSNDTAESSTLSVRTLGESKIEDFYIENLNITYNWWDETKLPTSQTNNCPAARIDADRAFVFNNSVETEYMTSFTSQYAPQSVNSQPHGDTSGENYVPQYERQHWDITYLANRVRTNGMGYEFMSTRNLKAIGNSVRGKGNNVTHGYRVTGYAAMPHMHSALVGNSAIGTGTGYSLQSGVRFNTINAATVDKAGTGLQVNNIGDLFYLSRNNYVQAVISDSTDFGGYFDNSHYNRYDLIVDGTKGSRSISMVGKGKGSLLDAIVTNSSGAGFSSNESGSVYRLIVDGTASTGAAIEGNNNIVDVVVGQSGFTGITISGSNNIVRVISTAANTNSNVLIIGSGNTVTADCALMRFDNAAQNNIIYGNIREFANVKENNISNCVGCSFTKTYYSQTTDAAGKIITLVPNTPKGAVTYALVSNVGLNGDIASVANKRTLPDGNVEVTTIFRGPTGELKANTVFTFTLMLRA